jgi:Tol biopolymer transport system component
VRGRAKVGEHVCPECSSPVGRYQWVCGRCGRPLVAPVVVRWLKLVAAGLLLSGPIAFLVAHAVRGGLGYNRDVGLGWLAIAVVAAAVGWMRPRIIGWVLLPASVAMLLLVVFGIEFGHGWSGEVWSLAEVLLVVLLAGVPFLAGVVLLVAGFAIRPWIGVAVVVAVAVITGYASVGVPGAGAPKPSRSVASPAWSPDGKHVAFVQESATPHRESGGDKASWSWTFKADIVVVNADGSRKRTLTRTPNRLESNPVWSPDGSEIVFVSEDERGNRDLFLIAADGSNPRRLTRSANLDEHSPAWSPDGTQITFVRTGAQEDLLAEGEQIGEIHVINADGTGQHKLTAGGDEAEDSLPAWSPDGTRIAFARGYGRPTLVIVMKADGTHPRPIRGAISPVWSPDSSRIAFIPIARGHFNLFIAKPDGTVLSKLTLIDPDTGFDLLQYAEQHRWSPDGRRIVYRLGEVEAESDDDVGDIVVIAADGTNRRNLTTTPTVDESAPAWSPDGTWIAYVRNDDQIRLTRPDGSHQHTIATAPDL